LDKLANLYLDGAYWNKVDLFIFMRSYLPTKDVKMFLDLLSDAYNERYNLQELICFLIDASNKSRKSLEEEFVSQPVEISNDANEENLAR
jgi:hypothetical protein